MLQYLRIRNLALMDEAELEFEPGFLAVTGETGAGKSVLLGALNLLAGARAEKTLIRQGEDQLEVEATLYFDPADDLDAWLEARELPPTEEGALVLSRALHRRKAGRVQINGRLSTVALLQELGERWIDFHGPGESQTLFREARQRELVDLFAQNATLLEDYGKTYHAWRESLEAADRLRSAERLSPDEVEFLQHQVDQIDRANLSEEGIADLERDHQRLSSAQDLIESTSHLSEALGGSDGISETLSPLLGQAQEAARLDESLQALAERLESLIIEADDLAEGFADAARECEFDDETAQELRERMELWLTLRRKYGREVSTVLEKREELARKIAIQGNVEGELERLSAEAAKLEKQLRSQGKALTTSREKAAETLAAEVTQLLGSLGFKKASFRIEVAEEKMPKEHGTSTCRFLFSPNPGQSPLPLSKIASSGEMARVMLALKAALAQVDSTPVMVFDEVDANVGGEVAVSVARELARLGKDHQVFCVTHLPQVAAQGSSHFLVVKDQTDESTTVQISTLHHSREAREAELARMLGDRKSQAARDHAKSLLASN